MRLKYVVFPAVLALGLVASLRAAEIESLDYASDKALKKAWGPQLLDHKPVPAEPALAPPRLHMTGDQVKAARFDLPFSKMTGWRFAWDKALKADISQAEQILLHLRADNPDAVGQVIVYLKSGDGWYRFPEFGVTKDWRTAVLSLDKAVKEGQPKGLHKIDRIRMGFLPGGQGDTAVDLAWIKTRAGWPIEHIGAMGPYKNYRESRAAIAAAAKGSPAFNDIKERINRADALYTQVRASNDRRRPRIQNLILDARELVAQAWALSLKSKKGEFRGVWIHHGDGTRSKGGERTLRWKEAIPLMADYGINAVLPNVLWSGTSYYPSKVVKPHPLVAKEGDFLQEIIDAAKPVGMEVYAWKVMWQFAEGWLAPEGRSDPYRAQGRLQVDKDGKEHPWLCPCDERNRKEELAAIMEMADYDIDGVHLDYIRYSSRSLSYSTMCRERFEKQRGKRVANWPADCAPGGKLEEEYHEFRKGTITSFVRQVRKALQKKKPGMKLTAAVFNVPGIAEGTVSQDWVKWGKEGLLDYIHTMTYTEDSDGFRSTVAAQKSALGNAPAKLIPGMQSTFDGGRSLPLADAVAQVLATRELGHGFVMFEWRDFLQDSFMPYFRAGLTRTGPYKLAFREIPEADRPVVGKRGQAPGDGVAWVFDDFDDGTLFSAERGRWIAEGDRNKLGTQVKPAPFKLQDGGPGGSKHFARIFGHYGESKAPWPSAILQSGILQGNKPADLSAYSAIEVDVKGDGKTYEAVLLRESVKDYAHFRVSFPATSEWKKVVLPLRKFEQPGWGKPVDASMLDVTHLRFQPAGTLSDVDFDLSVDNIRFVK